MADYANDRLKEQQARNQAAADKATKKASKPKNQGPKMAEKLPPKEPGRLSRAGSAVKDHFTKPLGGAKTTAKAGRLARIANATKTGAGFVARKGAGALMGPVGMGIAAGEAGYAAGTAWVENTESGEATKNWASDLMSKFSGDDDITKRMMSDDPDIAKAAVAEYRAGQQSPARPGQEQAAAPDVAAAEGAPQADEAQGSGEDTGTLVPYDEKGEQQAATELDIYGDSEAANPGLNADNLREIEGSDYSYAGRYGDTDVLHRPDPSGALNDNGSSVPEFSDKWSAFDAKRPGQRAEQIAAENARVEQSKEDYRRNTTMSDGRRAYGGNEELREAQMVEAGKGDADGIVARQLSEEGRTPEQRAAYAENPSGAYQTDAVANAASSRNQFDSYKHSVDQRRNKRTDARLDAAESRQQQTANGKSVTERMSGLKEDAANIHFQVINEAERQVANSKGELSLNQVLTMMFSKMDMEGGIPPVDDDDNVIFGGMQRPGTQQQAVQPVQ